MGIECGDAAGAPGGPIATVVEAIDAAVESGDAANGICGTAPSMFMM